jgi:hypothetical protein
LPKSREKIKGSSDKFEIGNDAIIDIIATKKPKSICRLWRLGEVIGSGSITMEKKRTVGSKNELRFIFIRA